MITISTRAWWTGVILLACAVLAHAAFPRYDWRAMADNPRVLIRIDRWTGRAVYGQVDWQSGTWAPVR